MAVSFAGVDYGSKLAGTTAWIHRKEDGTWAVFQSTKKENADQMLLRLAEAYQPSFVCLDAPLSLPKAYAQKEAAADSDFFYRAADRAVGAMSPMFLGGLTARAIRLKIQLASLGLNTLEVYPGYLARHYNLQESGYKKKKEHLSPTLELLQKHFPELRFPDIQNWHQFDALLAWLSGWRYQQDHHQTFGEQEEGVIII